MKRIVFVLLTISGAAASDLSGRWESDCTPLLRRHSIHSTIMFTSSKNVATVLDLYADSACQIHNLRIDYAAEYKIGEKFGEGVELDFLPLKVHLVISNPEVVAHYNLNRGCGYDDWKLNEPKDVSGRFCNPFQMPTVDLSIADIFALEDKILRFGAFPTLPKIQDGGRPSHLDGMLIFRRP